MPAQRNTRAAWTERTIELKIWKLAALAVVAPVLFFWYLVVHQNDEILALVRNEVQSDPSGSRNWIGSFVNTNDEPLRDVAVTVDFLDAQDRPVGRTDARTPELPYGERLDLQATLPADADKLRIYSVQWRKGRTAALMGPFREPWAFGYLMSDPAGIKR